MPTILTCVETIKQGKENHLIISELYYACIKIAKATVVKKYLSGKQSFYENESSVHNIATDSIAPLFSKTKSGGQIGLYHSIKQWQNPISTEEEAQFFIYKIVWSRVAQHISKILKENDPAFKKIYESIKHFVLKNGFNKITFLGTVYFTQHRDLKIYAGTISAEEFEKLPSSLFEGDYTSVFTKLFNYLETETEYFPAIPVNALTKKLKLLHGNQLANYSNQNISPAYEETIDVEKIMNEALAKIYLIIENSYAKTNKYNEETIEIFRSVLKDISEDFKNGGLTIGLYEYFKNYKKGLSKNDFYSLYHSQLNYLIKTMKKEIAGKINV